MAGRLTGKVALIAGAGNGMGRATAYLFAAEGAKVALCARRQALIEQTAIVMYLGEIVEEGQAEEIFNQPMHPYTQGLLSAALLGEQTADPRFSDNAQLQGEILALPPNYKGCKLYRRCPFAQDRCASEPQIMEDMVPGRRVRCWRAMEIQEKVAQGRIT